MEQNQILELIKELNLEDIESLGDYSRQYSRIREWENLLDSSNSKLNIPLRTVNKITDIIFAKTEEYRVPDVYTSNSDLNKKIEEVLYEKLMLEEICPKVCKNYLSTGNVLISYYDDEDGNPKFTFVSPSNVYPLKSEIYGLYDCIWWVPIVKNGENYLIVTIERQQERQIHIFKVIQVMSSSGLISDQYVEIEELDNYKKQVFTWKDKLPRFYWLGTGIKDSIVLNLPFDLSIYYQTEAINDIEYAWDKYLANIENSQKQMIVSKNALKGGFDFTKDTTYVAVNGTQRAYKKEGFWTVINDNNGKLTEPVKFISPEVAESQFKSAVDCAWSNYSQALNLGDSFFGGKGPSNEIEKTTTEVLLSNRDASNTIRRFRDAWERVLRWMVKLLAVRENIEINDVEIHVDFNDGVFVDPQKIRQEGVGLYNLKDADGQPLISREFLLKHYYNFDDSMIEKSKSVPVTPTQPTSQTPNSNPESNISDEELTNSLPDAKLPTQKRKTFKDI